jgi:predicted acyl esterase
MLRIGTVGCVLAGSIALPARAPAQSLAAQEAQAYIDSHAEIEDMVMVPMRDSVRLYHLILFPKGEPRQNMPTVMIRIPYLIDAHHMGDLFGPFVASFLKHGYAVVWEYERGRFYSQLPQALLRRRLGV